MRANRYEEGFQELAVSESPRAEDKSGVRLLGRRNIVCCLVMLGFPWSRDIGDDIRARQASPVVFV